MDETTTETLHVRFTKCEVAHEIIWLFGRPIIETDTDEALNKAAEELLACCAKEALGDDSR